MDKANSLIANALALIVLLSGCVSIPPKGVSHLPGDYDYLSKDETTAIRSIVVAPYYSEKEGSVYRPGAVAGLGFVAAVGAGAIAYVFSQYEPTPGGGFGGGIGAAIEKAFANFCAGFFGTTAGIMFFATIITTGIQADAVAILSESRDKIAPALADLQIHKIMAERITEYGSNATDLHFIYLKEDALTPGEQEHDYSSFTSRGTDHILEIGVSRIGLLKGRLYQRVQVRLLQIEDKREIFEEKFDHFGRTFKLNDLLDDVALLKAYTHSSIQELSERIVDTVFLMDRYTSRLPYDRTDSGLAFVPIDAVKSIQPRLVWRAFPSPTDIKMSWLRLKNATHVTYDIRVWKDEDPYPAELVYERRGLLNASHTLEQPLEPDTKYHWSIRARYLSNGQTRVTRWTRRWPFTTPSVAK